MPGSDNKINYQVRPAKSIERKMLCDLVKEIQILEGDNEIRYIGLGAKYFSDFLLFHNMFAINDMISIEAEKDAKSRYEFNKPLKCIDMYYGTTNEILPQLRDFDKKTNFVWLDYDDAFEEEMLYDVETLCRNLGIGSMFFISCNYSYKGEKVSEKQSSFRNLVGSFFDEQIDVNQYTNNNMPKIIKSIFDDQISKVLSMRNRFEKEKHYEFYQLMFLKYKDGAPMMTIGGIIVDEELKTKLDNSKIFFKLDFLSKNDEIYYIDIPKLTNKEIQLILKNIPISEEEYEEKKANFHGIEYKEIKKFERIYRYYPYYSEGYFTT